MFTPRLIAIPNRQIRRFIAIATASSQNRSTGVRAGRVRRGGERPCPPSPSPPPPHPSPAHTPASSPTRRMHVHKAKADVDRVQLVGWDGCRLSVVGCRSRRLKPFLPFFPHAPRDTCASRRPYPFHMLDFCLGAVVILDGDMAIYRHRVYTVVSDCLRFGRRNYLFNRSVSAKIFL